ncbi:MAG: hypothetical protein ACMX3H_16100 [Sodalis sp. (in: enterobacteria)]|uniref:hypothetical protein n=1 Tax=Sodalis sp. (in: enterobacteria) TaxID=1898979 RepID=UPI0039E6EEF1
MEHILTGPYNKPTNNSRRPPRGAYKWQALIAPGLIWGIVWRGSRVPSTKSGHVNCGLNGPPPRSGITAR